MILYDVEGVMQTLPLWIRKIQHRWVRQLFGIFWGKRAFLPKDIKYSVFCSPIEYVWLKTRRLHPKPERIFIRRRKGLHQFLMANVTIWMSQEVATVIYMLRRLGGTYKYLYPNDIYIWGEETLPNE